MAKSEFSTLAKLARHYEIFEHLFQKKEFMPTVGLSVTFEEKYQVHYGNFLTPSQVCTVGHLHLALFIVIKIKYCDNNNHVLMFTIL